MMFTPVKYKCNHGTLVWVYLVRQPGGCWYMCTRHVPRGDSFIHTHRVNWEVTFHDHGWTRWKRTLLNEPIVINQSFNIVNPSLNASQSISGRGRVAACIHDNWMLSAVCSCQHPQQNANAMIWKPIAHTSHMNIHTIVLHLYSTMTWCNSKIHVNRQICWISR